jgi:hypothetical protein
MWYAVFDQVKRVREQIWIRFNVVVSGRYWLKLRILLETASWKLEFDATLKPDESQLERLIGMQYEVE